MAKNLFATKIFQGAALALVGGLPLLCILAITNIVTTSFVAVGKLTIKAIKDTFLKREPVQSAELKEAEKLFIKIGAELGINWYRRQGDHVKVSLINAVNGYHDWFLYFDHIEALENGKVKDTFDDVSLISKHEAEEIFGNAIRDNELKDLNKCLQNFQINTDLRIQHFMAQIAHESAGLKWMKELASGWAYDISNNPKLATELGNFRHGDGPLYKGAGPIQLTGGKNYRGLAAFTGDNKIIERGCNYVATYYPFTAAGFWWDKLNHMNTLCDRGATCREVSARVNGRDPANGLADRERYYKRACAVIK